MSLVTLRSIAFDAKKKFYETGKPCKRGHIARRYTANTYCVLCVIEKSIEQHNRRAREWGADGTLCAQDIFTILNNQHQACAICGIDVSDDASIDHIRSLSKGGSNWPDNIQVLCWPCNNRKGAGTLQAPYQPENSPPTRLMFSLSDQQVEYLKRKAESLGISVSEYLRRIVDRDRQGNAA